jgi:4-oxalocrotonate tautomerase
MPVVSVKIARGRSIEQKRSLIEAVTDAVVSSIDVKPENIATGGESLSDKFGPGFGK